MVVEGEGGSFFIKKMRIRCWVNEGGEGAVAVAAAAVVNICGRRGWWLLHQEREQKVAVFLVISAGFCVSEMVWQRSS